MDRLALFSLISIFFPMNPTSKGKAVMKAGEVSNVNPTSNEEAIMEAEDGSNLNPMTNEQAILDEAMNDGENLPAQDDQPPQVEDMPLAKIETIMKRILPNGTTIEDDVTKMMRGCMSEFVRYIIREAENETQNARRRLIRTDDILSAMQKVGFSNYIDPVTAHLEEWRKRKQVPKRNKRNNAGSSSK